MLHFTDSFCNFRVRNSPFLNFGVECITPIDFIAAQIYHYLFYCSQTDSPMCANGLKNQQKIFVIDQYTCSNTACYINGSHILNAPPSRGGTVRIQGGGAWSFGVMCVRLFGLVALTEKLVSGQLAADLGIICA